MKVCTLLMLCFSISASVIVVMVKCLISIPSIELEPLGLFDAMMLLELVFCRSVRNKNG